MALKGFYYDNKKLIFKFTKVQWCFTEPVLNPPNSLVDLENGARNR